MVFRTQKNSLKQSLSNRSTLRPGKAIYPAAPRNLVWHSNAALGFEPALTVAVGRRLLAAPAQILASGTTAPGPLSTGSWMPVPLPWRTRGLKFREGSVTVPLPPPETRPILLNWIGPLFRSRLRPRHRLNRDRYQGGANFAYHVTNIRPASVHLI